MPTLESLIQIGMSNRQREAIARIDREDFSLVVYKVKKAYKERSIEHPAAFYDAGILALKQYYSTTIFDPLNMHAVADDLDRFWHEHVVDTARYSLLCDDIKGFMHHDPLDRTNLHKVCAIAQVYVYTYKVLSKIYGKANLSKIFFPEKPEMDFLVCRHDVEPKLHESTPMDDVFPVDKDLAKFRDQYGNSAKRKQIQAKLG